MGAWTTWCGGVAGIVLLSIAGLWTLRKEAREAKLLADSLFEDKRKTTIKSFSDITISVIEKSLKTPISELKDAIEKGSLTRQDMDTITQKYFMGIQNGGDVLKLSTDQIQEFVDTAYVHVTLENFSNEFSYLVRQLSISILAGFLLSLLLFTFGVMLELPAEFEYLSIPIFYLNSGMLYATGLSFGTFARGLYQIRILDKLNTKLDLLSKAEDIESLFDLL